LDAADGLRTLLTGREVMVDYWFRMAAGAFALIGGLYLLLMVQPGKYQVMIPWFGWLVLIEGIILLVHGIGLVLRSFPYHFVTVSCLIGGGGILWFDRRMQWSQAGPVPALRLRWRLPAWPGWWVVPARTAGLLLVAAGIAQALVCVVVAACAPHYFTILYRLETLGKAWEFMPTITRVAVRGAFVIPLLHALVCVVSLFWLKRCPDRILTVATVGLCAEGLVTWSTMFCFCFEGFTGLMCMHHGPRFELPEFLTFAWGVFPITLILILAPMAAALWPTRTDPRHS
jgi:hypothetical protein